MPARKSARIAAIKPKSQTTRSKTRRDAPDDSNFLSEDPSVASPSESEPSEPESDSDVIDTRPTKRRKTQPAPKRAPKRKPPTNPPSLPSSDLTASPLRTHTPAYHTPLLLTSPTTRTALLTWFDATSTARSMPWRQPFTPPSTLPPAALSQRAYQVWISEIMLQQTRVAVVIGYWTRWMARWPRISDLAAATEEEVVGMWQGLGYYSRARRVWQAARMVCGEMGGMLPGEVGGLMKVPGVGRYTAGAVASIVFGVAAPVVDGNVLRVLSRQMGVLGDVKGDKGVIELLWAAAEELVKAVAGDGDGEEPSDRPGRWGQAMMELGSTVCTPKPNCAACPITDACRAYAEGVALAGGRNCNEDIEDLCGLCAPLEEADEGSATATTGAKDKGKASRFFEAAKVDEKANTKTPAADARTMDIVIQHAKKFPLRKPKKKVREEETLVCAIRRPDGHYLIHQRPEKGLLAGLWELASEVLPETNSSTAKNRKTRAVSYVTDLVQKAHSKGSRSTLKHVGELGSVPWLFSHLKLTMHVHLFELDDVAALSETSARARWASVEDIDKESMGTGMRKCWSMVKEKIKLD